MPIGSRGYPLGSLGARACFDFADAAQPGSVPEELAGESSSRPYFHINFHASCHLKFDT